MASNFVSGTYRTYKAGTKKILDWLYENASKCGYGTREQTDDDNDEEEAGPSQPKRKSKPKPKPKKGKGSKAKGSGKAKAKKVGGSLDETPRVIGVNEFVTLAEAIAASSAKIKVPLWVTSMIEEVISGRKKSARWFSRQAGDATSADFEDSNGRHQHFIGVLENVLQILTELQEPHEAKPAKLDLENGDPLENVTNIFATLEIEPDTEHTATESTPSAPKPKPVLLEEDHSMEETLWLVYCFFEDFNIAREHIKDLWTTYKYGRVDLPTAALSTNTTFELLKRAELQLLEDLKTTLPEDLIGSFKGYKEIQAILYAAAAVAKGLDPIGRLSRADPYDFRLWEIADWLGLPVFLILSEFVPITKRSKISPPLCKPGHFGKLNLNEDVLTPKEKYQQDSVFLLEYFLPEFFFVQHHVNPQTNATMKYPAQDELTGGILNYVRTQEIPIWLVLALQIQLDIHYMLLRDIARPHSDLFTAAKRATNSLESYLAYTDPIKIGNGVKENDRMLKLYIWEWGHWILSDTLDPLRTKAFAGLGFSKRGDFALLRLHPVLCGMMLFRVHLTMQTLGIALVNGWGALPNILHLYNACLSEDVLNAPWLDLEALVLTHTARRIFVGDRPQVPSEYLKRFKLVMGHSATEFAANRRAIDRLPVSRRGPRQMLAGSILGEIYEKRYVLSFYESQDTRASLTLDSVEKLLGGATTETDSGEAANVAAGIEGGSFRNSLLRHRADTGLLSKFKKTHKLSTIQFLTALESSLEHETFAMRVDYFSLHTRCFELLRRINREMDIELKQCFGPTYIENASELPFLVGYILRTVAGDDGADATVQPRMLSRGKGNSIIAKAGQILARLIEQEGDAEITKVKSASSVFEGLDIERPVVAPNLDQAALSRAVQAFNALPRPKTIPTGPGPNHWHISVRHMSSRMQPPDAMYLVSPENSLMHVAAPPKDSTITNLPTLSDKADLVALILVESFVGPYSVLKGNHAHYPKFAPWTWSCNDSALADMLQKKFKELGVREGLCDVQIASADENRLCDEVWKNFRNKFLEQMGIV